MSLINEALKRTRDATYPGTAVSAPSLGSYRVGPSAAKPVFGIWHFLVIGAVILALIAGTYQFARSHISTLQQAMTVRDGSASAEPVAIGPQPSVHRVVPPPPTTFEVVSPEQAKAAEDALVERLMTRLRVSAPPVPEPVSIKEPGEPGLKLQGIMRDHDSFEAMINGYTYRVGDAIEGGRITAIDQRIVQLEMDGRPVELRLR